MGQMTISRIGVQIWRICFVIPHFYTFKNHKIETTYAIMSLGQHLVITKKKLQIRSTKGVIIPYQTTIVKNITITKI